MPSFLRIVWPLSNLPVLSVLHRFSIMILLSFLSIIISNKFVSQSLWGYLRFLLCLLSYLCLHILSPDGLFSPVVYNFYNRQQRSVYSVGAWCAWSYRNPSTGQLHLDICFCQAPAALISSNQGYGKEVRSYATQVCRNCLLTHNFLLILQYFWFWYEWLHHC